MTAKAKTVLLVDDHEDILELLAIHFREAGFRVLHASDGAAALACIESSPVDAVVTDVTMPGMNGLDLLLRIKARHPCLPVVLHSSVDLGRLTAGLADGALRKPCSPEALIRTVERACAFVPAP